ncbi:MAG: Ig-like domain repeat protein [Bryobacteraceae bacterium]
MLAGGIASAQAVNYSNSNQITVPDSTTNTAAKSDIVVSGFAGTVNKVTITLTQMTGFIGEIDLELVAPNGSKFVLLSDCCSTATSSTNLTLTLDDAATNLLPVGVASSGTFKPTNLGATIDTWPSAIPQPACPSDYAAGTVMTSCPGGASQGTGTFANHFDGINPNGTWSLYAVDDTAGDASITIQGWTLSITPNSLPATTTTASASANPATRNVAVNLLATVTSSSTVNQGTVQFTKDGVNLGNAVSVSNGSATLTNQLFTSEGDFVIGAQYTDNSSTFSSSSGSFTLTVQNATTGTPPTFCNAAPLTINTGASAPIAGTPNPQRITVSALSGTVSNLVVALNGITHPTPADFDLLLVSPTGQKMVILSDVGGSVSVSNANIILDDTAAASLPNLSVLSSGIFKPTNYGTGDTFASPAPAGPYSNPAPAGSDSLASTFAGVNPNGTWMLYAATDIPGNTGSIGGGYCLTFTTSGDSSTTTTVSSSKNPSLVNESVTFTAQALRSSDSSPVPAGTFTFRLDGIVVSGPTTVDGTGSATYATAALTEGLHTIQATYSGTSGYATSTASEDQEVDTPTTVTGTSFCNNGGISLNGTGNALVYPSRVFVTNLPGFISAVNLRLNNFTASHANDPDILLVGPTGATLIPWSDIGSISGGFTNQTFTLSDSAASSLPSTGGVTTGTYKPTNYDTADSFPSPAPAPPWNSPAPAGSSTLASIFGNTAATGTWALYVTDDTPDPGTGGSIGGWCLDFTMLQPDLKITKTHTGSFVQGQTGATYTIQVQNAGTAVTAGTVTVTESVPAGLTLVSQSGSGWDCSVVPTCTRSDALAASQFYPDITVTVNVASNASSSLTNTASVSGGSDSNAANNTANDVTAVLAAVSFGTTPVGLSYSVNGTPQSTTTTQNLASGTVLTLATTTPQTATGTRYNFLSWSDAGALSHPVTISNSVNSYVASFQTQYQLTSIASPVNGGTVTPASGSFFDANTQVPVTETPAACYVFSSWSGNVQSGSVLMNAPHTVTATFAANIASNVTAQLSPVYGGFRLNRATNKWMQAVTLTNHGAALAGIVFAADSLSSNATLSGAGGATSCATPVSPYKAIGQLGAGATVTFYLQFDNPTNAPIRYTGRLLAAPGQL